jgi:hypothetical protein
MDLAIVCHRIVHIIQPTHDAGVWMEQEGGYIEGDDCIEGQDYVHEGAVAS